MLLERLHSGWVQVGVEWGGPGYRARPRAGAVGHGGIVGVRQTVRIAGFCGKSMLLALCRRRTSEWSGALLGERCANQWR